MNTNLIFQQVFSIFFTSGAQEADYLSFLFAKIFTCWFSSDSMLTRAKKQHLNIRGDRRELTEEIEAGLNSPTLSSLFRPGVVSLPLYLQGQ